MLRAASSTQRNDDPNAKNSQIAVKMPGQLIDRPNPKPRDSSVPDSVLSLAVKLEKLHVSDDDLQALQDFRRASNYIAAGQSINWCKVVAYQ
jgi:hypothetical protein